VEGGWAAGLLQVAWPAARPVGSAVVAGERCVATGAALV